MGLLNKKLKQSKVIHKSLKNQPVTNMYVVENDKDLKLFLNSFKKMDMKLFTDPIRKMISKGEVILLNDPNRMSGFNTYQTETESTIRI